MELYLCLNRYHQKLVFFLSFGIKDSIFTEIIGGSAKIKH